MARPQSARRRPTPRRRDPNPNQNSSRRPSPDPSLDPSQCPNPSHSSPSRPSPSRVAMPDPRAGPRHARCSSRVHAMCRARRLAAGRRESRWPTVVRDSHLPEAGHRDNRLLSRRQEVRRDGPTARQRALRHLPVQGSTQMQYRSERSSWRTPAELTAQRTVSMTSVDQRPGSRTPDARSYILVAGKTTAVMRLLHAVTAQRRPQKHSRPAAPCGGVQPIAFGTVYFTCSREM